MGKSWVWVVLLVVVVAVIAFMVTRTKGKKPPPPTNELQTTMPGFNYEVVARNLSKADDYGKKQIIGESRDMPFIGTGWVTAVEPMEDGGQRVKITVKAPGTGGGEPEIIAEVPKDKIPQGVQFTAGQKVSYVGYAKQIDTDPMVVVHIGLAQVTPEKTKK